MNVRLKRPAQTDQSGKIANERQWVALLTLAYLHSPHAMRVEKRSVMPSSASIDDLMAFPRLSASQIDGDIDVPITMHAVLDQVVLQDGFAVRACSKAPVKSLLFGFYGHDLRTCFKVLAQLWPFAAVLFCKAAARRKNMP